MNSINAGPAGSVLMSVLTTFLVKLPCLFISISILTILNCAKAAKNAWKYVRKKLFPHFELIKILFGVNLMRRFVCISMVFLFFLSVVTGLAEAHVHPGDAGHHIITVILFVILALTHILINRKPFARYFTVAVKKAG
jgi:hypothetical protein